MTVVVTPIYILRMTPVVLLSHSGYPMNQGGYPPCNVCPFSDANSKLKECSFYFGSFEKDRLDKLMWLYRFKVYRERDRDLLMYKALYLASELLGLKLRDFGEKVGDQFCGLELDMESFRIYQYSCKMMRSRSSCGAFEVNFRKFETHENARIGVYEIVREWSKDSGHYENADILILKRRLLPCEGSARMISLI